jgi:uncharacterized protein
MIKRDFLDTIRNHPTLESTLLWGPRQVGKSTLLDQLLPKSMALLDDLSQRAQAESDPEFFLEQLRLPTLIDEVQYAPNLFPEIKLRIDRERRRQLKENIQPPRHAQYWLTCSNRTLLESSIQESLAGRCSIFELHGLTVREIWRFAPDLPLKTIAFRGGFPELYRRPELSPVSYLNDYILTFVEKDLARGAGIEKSAEFLALLRLLAARNGQFLNFAELAQAIGVDGKTVKAWVELLRRNFIVGLIEPWASNLSKRIVRMSKIHFYDVGLCARLQGHPSEETILQSPQAGALFESLVFGEIVKTKSNYLLNFDLFTWRTKEGAEIDFVTKTHDKTILIEAKLGIQSAQAIHLDPEAIKVFQDPIQKLVVTAGGETARIAPDTLRLPIGELGNWLRTHVAS